VIGLETEVNVTETAVQDDFEVEPGTLWTNGEEVFVLVEYMIFVEYVNSQTSKGELLYVAASLSDGKTWNTESATKKHAVEGLEPFEGNVKISQYKENYG